MENQAKNAAVESAVEATEAPKSRTLETWPPYRPLPPEYEHPLCRGRLQGLRHGEDGRGPRL